MIYRLKSANQTARRLRLLAINMRDDAYLMPQKFEAKFKEITLDPLWPHGKMLKAPLIDEDQHRYDMQFFKRKTLPWIPDIWVQGEEAIVSQTVREIIEDFDDFGHQFWSMSFLDHSGNVVNEQPYYFLNVRRILEIEDLELPMSETYFHTSPREEDYLPTIQNTPDLRQRIESLPLWRNSRNRGTIYLNAAMVARLRAEKVTGMDELSVKYGQREESLGLV